MFNMWKSSPRRYFRPCYQDDIKKLKDNKEQLNDEIGLVEKRLSDLKQHLGELKTALSETGWEVKQKNGEISLLKNQLKDVLSTGREAQNQVYCRGQTIRDL